MTTLYKKVGKRYRPVAEHEEWDSYPEGAHLVVCRPGSTMRRFNVDPDRAGLLAAAERLREALKPFATIDLLECRLPPEFAMHVLRARGALTPNPSLSGPLR